MNIYLSFLAFASLPTYLLAAKQASVFFSIG